MKSKTNGTDLSAKNAIQTNTQLNVNLHDQIARFQKKNSQRNCYIFKAKIAASKKPNQTGFQKKDIIQKRRNRKKDC